MGPAAVLACLSLIVQPVLAQYFNVSMTTTAPSSSPTNGTGPTYDDWKYDGCYQIQESFPGFDLVATSPNMTVECCQSYCIVGFYKYAALLETYNVPTNHVTAPFADKIQWLLLR